MKNCSLVLFILSVWSPFYNYNDQKSTLKELFLEGQGFDNENKLPFEGSHNMTQMYIADPESGGTFDYSDYQFSIIADLLLMPSALLSYSVSSTRDSWRTEGEVEEGARRQDEVGLDEDGRRQQDDPTGLHLRRLAGYGRRGEETKSRS